MGLLKTRTLAKIIFFLTWVSFLVSVKILKDTLILDPSLFRETSIVLLLYINIPIFFIWLTMGPVFGAMSTMVSALFTLLLFGGGISAFPVSTYILMSFIGSRMQRSFEKSTKNLEVSLEKIDGELNVLRQKITSEENDNLRMRSSLKKITRLKTVIDDYNLTLDRDNVLDAIVRNSFELFQDANRVLVYLVDTEKQELALMRSKKRNLAFPVRAKKGDVFDRWVLKQKKALFVDDIRKDFRFSADAQLDKGFNSIISAPLTSENQTFGILRIDSKEKGRFTQSDLRFLDIVADLSGVSLQNALLYKKVQNLAIHDSLTGLFIHKYFVERLKDEVKRALRHNRDFSLLMLDIDNFKAYNDQYGHNAGDLALRHISSILKSFAKSGDIVARYGGEEFAFLLVDKGKKEAVKIAEDIRRKVEDNPLVLRREKTPITISIGVASCPSEEKMSEEFLRLVDSRLYKAKEKGRNRVWSG